MPTMRYYDRTPTGMLTKTWEANSEQDAFSEFLDADWTPVIRRIEKVSDDATVNATSLTVTVES